MTYKIHEEGEFRYVESGEGPTLVLLHGLFGALSNFKPLIMHFEKTHKVVIPLLPLYTLPLDKTSVPGFVNYVHEFLEYKGYNDDLILLGNSLGGHIALMFTLEYAAKVKALILTGSSGLFEDSMGDTFPKRGDYNFVKEKTQYTFYDPNVATKELVDEVFELVNNRDKALRIIYTARSAMRNNLADKIDSINIPTKLIWGKQDLITPPFVAEEFNKLMPNASLSWIDKCGHAAMMEHPEEFNALLELFLNELKKAA